MTVEQKVRLRAWGLTVGAAIVAAAVSIPAQQMVTETRDPAQRQDEDFAKSVKEWTTQPFYTSPLVDHLPRVPGIPMPKDVLGYHVGAPGKLTYYADIVKYYRALAAAAPNRVKIETIGKSDEDRELIVVWVSSDANIKNLQVNRDNLAKIADPRGLTPEQARTLIATTKPQYHLMGGLHSGETGPSEMLMELTYRLVTETSPLIKQIRDNVIVSVTPVADPDGRDRNVDWFYKNLEASAGAAGGGGRGGGGALPYWGKYVYHDNNRDINLSQVSMRALADFYFTAHPPIMHDLHEAQPLLYTYSGGPPQNPNLDPILFTELPFFANFELAQMTKWGMPGVYTHAFMDGWSPGYLGSVAYNHNGMMRMYETQSGTDQAGTVTTSQGAPAAATTQSSGAAAAAPSATATPVSGTAVPPAGTAATARTPATAAGTPAVPGNPAAPAEGGRGAGRGRGSRGDATQAGRGGEGAGRGATPTGEGGGDATAFQGRGAGAPGPSTGRGGGQPREWYRGIPIPPGAVQNFSRRNNTNYMQTGVLSGLQLTSMIPNLVIENFYRKTMNSIEAGKTEAPYGYVIPPQRDMTRVATLVNLLRGQRIEVGRASGEIKLSDGTFPAGSYVIKRDQPYGRLAKNLLEKQNYPDPNLRTYDDSGWTMGLASLVDIKEIKDKAVLAAQTTPVTEATAKGQVTGGGSAGIAVAHLGSNNMVAFRYKLKTVAMKIADKSFTAAGIEFPAGSFIVAPGSDAQVKAAVEEFGLTAAALTAAPSVATHDADAPRVAMFTSWGGTQEIGWVRFTFDKFGIPFDLIYKERVKKGNLRADYDVIVMPTQTLGRTAVFQAPAARPVSYVKSDKYKFLGMYGSSEDITGGFGAEGVDAFQQFLNAGGTLITMGNAVRFPTELGMARTVDASGNTSANFYAPRPIVNAEVLRLDHPVFYGYTERIMPLKYLGGPLLTVGEPDRANVLARYVGGDAAVLSGLMRGADEIRDRPFAVEVPGGFSGKGRVIMFANNPIYRWQNHGEFNMVFNSILNWNDLGAAARSAPSAGQ